MAAEAPKQNKFDLEGKLAVVTGAANGIGKSIAIHCAINGCKIALVDIDETALNKLQNNLNALFSNQIHSFICDVSKESNVVTLIDQIKSKFNTNCIQLLFNNVGLLSLTTNILDGDINNLRKIMDVNVWSMIYGIRLFLPLLLNNDDSIQCYIVNTGSTASIQTADSVYGITKQTVLGIGETVESELKWLYRKKYGKVKCNILVSTFCPGCIKNTQLMQSSVNILNSLSYNELERELNKKDMKQRIFRINQSMPNVTVFNTLGIEANEAVKYLFDGLKKKKTVITTDQDWFEACIRDRMSSILNGKSNDGKQLRNVIENGMQRKLQQSKSKL